LNILNKNNLYIFIYGFVSTISIRVLGIIYISEVLSILFLPFSIKYFINNGNKKSILLSILLIIWMISIPISDVYNGSEINDFLKGFFGVIPFLSSLLFAFYFLNKNIKLTIPFIWGFSFSFLWTSIFGIGSLNNDILNNESVNNITELYYFNKIIIWVLSSFISLALSISFYKKYPLFITLIILLFSFISLLNGTRSVFLLNFVTSVILIVNFLKNKFFPTLSKFKFSFATIILLIIFFFFAKNLYESSINLGLLGEEEVLKYESQSNSEFGLLSGRGEFIASLLAISDSFWFGHGSYAKDKNGYGYTAALISGDDRILEGKANYIIGETNIPTHSHLWFAWVNHGFLAAIFWLYLIFFICFKYLLKHLFNDTISLSFNVYAILFLTWTVLFSPFSQKTLVGFLIIYFILIVKKKRIKLKTPSVR